MAGQSSAGAGAMGGGRPNAGPGTPEEQQLQQAAGSPAATQADLLQMQQRMGASPIFGQQGGQAGAMGGPGQRIEAIKKMLASAGGGEGGTTRVRRRAQPVMGSGALG